MPTSTVLYIVLSVLLSVAVSFFQYFYKTKKAPKVNVLLFILRAMSLFLIGLLLINPKIKSTETEDIKPVLSFLIDNSLSTKHFKEEASVNTIVEEVAKSKDLNDKFDVSYFSFGKNINTLDSLSFDEAQTNISKGITTVNNIQKKKIGAMVLVSDGNQTIGNDYEFVNSKQPVYPLIVGDTTQFQDLKISQLNVNKYSYVNNKFPVEVLLFYDGEKAVESVFTITHDGKKVFSERVKFSANEKTKTITTNLKALKEGVQYYSASVSKITNEKNTKNNYKSFAVEVIDEQTKVLILSSILHPDLGAFKKSIESNKQRKVTISLVDSFKGQLKDFQLVMFYQPNASFKKWMTERKSNFILVTGVKTDWKFINSLAIGLSKDALRQSENYSAFFNSDFATFIQKNIQFSEFPPLEDKFGQLTVKGEHQKLLFQKLKGIHTEQPLIATFENTDDKWTAILGEGIWKWRSASFLEEESFEPFDAFIGNLVKYTISNKKRNRLEVNVKKLYPANSTIDLVALYLDKNYQFDNRASLQLTVTNSETKAKKTIPFSLINNSYKVSLEGLTSGSYSYTVTVNGQNISRSGRFKVTDYQVEEQFTSANVDKLKQLALKTKATVFYKNETEKLISELVNNKEYYKTQKLKEKEENLINWHWILFAIAGLLAVEWFIRKYIGKI